MPTSEPAPTETFSLLVALACHDLRTPLATVSGATKMLTRQGTLGETQQRLAELMDGAAGEMASLLDQLTLAARIACGRYEPRVRAVDTLELAETPDQRISVAGAGTVVETDVEAVTEALKSFALAALRHGDLAGVAWTVDGRRLVLAPLGEEAAAVVAGNTPRDLRCLVGRMVIETLGGQVTGAAETVTVELAA
jgi:signal transduction histidine kinase